MGINLYGKRIKLLIKKNTNVLVSKAIIAKKANINLQTSKIAMISKKTGIIYNNKLCL